MQYKKLRGVMARSPVMEERTKAYLPAARRERNIAEVRVRMQVLRVRRTWRTFLILYCESCWERRYQRNR